MPILSHHSIWSYMIVHMTKCFLPTGLVSHLWVASLGAYVVFLSTLDRVLYDHAHDQVISLRRALILLSKLSLITPMEPTRDIDR